MTAAISQRLNYSLKPKSKFNLLEKDRQGADKKNTCSSSVCTKQGHGTQSEKFLGPQTSLYFKLL